MSESVFDSRFHVAEASPGFLLWKVANLHQKLQRRALQSVGLTPTEFSVLACFSHLAAHGEVTQTDVCVFAELEKMIVSDATRSLVAKHFLIRKASEVDRRASTVRLTAAGQKRCNEAVRIVEEFDETFFGVTGEADVFAQHLRAILKAAEMVPR